MSHRGLSVWLATTVGVLLLAAGAGPAAAITLKPSLAPIRITARPGQMVTTTYELALEAGEPRAHFKVSVQDWWRNESGRQSFYAPAGSLSRSCGTWVSTDPVESAASGGEPLKVRVTVAVPADLRPGGYWCALTIDEVPDPLAPAADGVGVSFLASISTGIYVNIDPIERGADITGVAMRGNEIVVTVRNSGNAPAVVEGRIEFLRPGTERSLASVDLERAILLTEPIPFVEQTIPLPSAAQLPSGTYVVRLIIDIGLDHYIGVQRELDIRRTVTPAE